MSFRTTTLLLLYFASSSPAVSSEAPGGSPMGAGPVASMPGMVAEVLVCREELISWIGRAAWSEWP